jgi:hypothetical protein
VQEQHRLWRRRQLELLRVQRQAQLAQQRELQQVRAQQVQLLLLFCHKQPKQQQR